MKNLAEFKKYLATEGASLRMVSIEHFQNGEWVSRPPFNPNFREVSILQTNAVALVTEGTKSGVSWLYFGKASEWAFDRGASLAVNCSGGTRITYAWANLALTDGN